MLSLVYFYLLFYVLHFPLFNWYKKAGKNPMHVFIPLAQDFTLMEIIGRPKKQAYWGLVPYINMLFGLTWVPDICNSFGKRNFIHHFFAIMFSPLYFLIIGFLPDLKYEGPSHTPDGEPKKKRSMGREWADALLFAFVAATIIRFFVIEAYKIPTTSLEGSLLEGDFLFVSKLNYGARVPMTPIAFPLAHHTMPLGLGKAYSKLVELPYFRLPGLQDIKNNDIVVFNYPGDAYENPERPVDKRENYVKRCVGIPGDDILIKDRELYVNGKHVPHFSKMQFAYDIYTNKPFTIESLADLKIDWYKDILLGRYMDGLGQPVRPLDELKQQFMTDMVNNPHFIILLNDEQLAAIKKLPNVDSIRPINTADDVYQYHDTTLSVLFPNDTMDMQRGGFARYKWDLDNYGPIHIPKKGEVVTLSSDNIYFYYNIITTHEGNTLKMENGKFIINGKPETTYTVKQNYYWMMGDNRDNSADSRFWGYVPENHIVGKPLFVWFSKNNFSPFFESIRWNRIMRSVKSLVK